MMMSSISSTGQCHGITPTGPAPIAATPIAATPIATAAAVVVKATTPKIIASEQTNHTKQNSYLVTEVEV